MGKKFLRHKINILCLFIMGFKKYKKFSKKEGNWKNFGNIY